MQTRLDRGIVRGWGRPVAWVRRSYGAITGNWPLFKHETESIDQAMLAAGSNDDAEPRQGNPI